MVELSNNFLFIFLLFFKPRAHVKNVRGSNVMRVLRGTLMYNVRQVEEISGVVIVAILVVEDS